MKNLLSTLLVGVLLLGLVSCGSTTTDASAEPTPATATEADISEDVETQEEPVTIPTTEELLEIATEISAVKLLENYDSNVVSAALTHGGQTYLIHGYIGTLSFDAISLNTDNGGLEIPLSLTELAALKEGQYVAVVATIAEVNLENTEDTADLYSPIVSYGYVVSTAVEITGRTGLLSNYDDPDIWNIQIIADETHILWDAGSYYTQDSIYVQVDVDTMNEIKEQVISGNNTICVVANAFWDTGPAHITGWLLKDVTTLDMT